MFTSLLFPFINAMLFLWSFFVVSPISRTKSLLSNWWRESRQSTPTNTNTVEINGMFASFSDEMEVMKVKYYIKASTNHFGLVNVQHHCDAEDIFFTFSPWTEDLQFLQQIAQPISTLEI